MILFQVTIVCALSALQLCRALFAESAERVLKLESKSEFRSYSAPGLSQQVCFGLRSE
jgi:hypothetical protein